MAIVDVDEERGKELQKTFEEQYGEGCAKFIKCDVSVERELKGFQLFISVITM